MSKIKFYISIVIIALIFVGCKTPKSSVETSKKYEGLENQYTALVSSYKAWNTLQTSGKINIDMGKKVSSSIQIKMEKGKSIFISIRPMLGMEMGKIYMTSDSIYMLDKMNKRYIAENGRAKLSAFTPLNPVPFTRISIVSPAW